MIWLWLIPAIIAGLGLIVLDILALRYDKAVGAQGVRVGDALLVTGAHISALIPAVNLFTMIIVVGALYEELSANATFQKILDYRIGGKPPVEHG